MLLGVQVGNMFGFRGAVEGDSSHGMLPDAATGGLACDDGVFMTCVCLIRELFGVISVGGSLA